MIPGPTIFRACSDCAKAIRQNTVASGNTFGATHWTDGKCEAPMFPDSPWLIKCPECQALLWIDELEELGQASILDAEYFAFDGVRCEIPSQAEYLSFLETGTHTPTKEQYLRLRAWWAGNDARREGACIGLSAAERANLLALAAMLDGAEPYDLLMKAEIMRELGRFDEALELLAGCPDGILARRVTAIRELAEKQDAWVRQLEPIPPFD